MASPSATDRRVTLREPATSPTAPPNGQILPGLRGRLDFESKSTDSSRVVFVVERRTRRRLACKMASIANASAWDAVVALEAEAKALRSLRHPNLCRFVEHGECEGGAYLLTERAPGESLQFRLDRGDRWTDEKLRCVAERLLTAIQYLHELNPPLFHCDVQPEHVVVSDRGDTTLVAFGAARSLLDDPCESVARPGYGHPGAGGVAADLYGAGATIAAIASGVDAALLPCRGTTIDLAACMRPSPVRDAVSLLLAAREQVHCTAGQVLALLRRSP